MNFQQTPDSTQSARKPARRSLLWESARELQAMVIRAAVVFSMVFLNPLLTAFISPLAFARSESGKEQRKLKSVLHSEPTQNPAGPALTLSSFLNQVTSQHDGYKAADKGRKASRDTSAEASLIFKPSAVASAQYMADGFSNPFNATDKLHLSTYNAGVSQNTAFGLSGKLTYNRTDMSMPPSSYSPAGSKYASDWFQLDLTQSLWRNWAGSELRAQETAAEAGSLANSYSQVYASKQILLSAESAYWQLALAREMVEVQADAVKRAQRIKDWTDRRVRLNLVDRAEGLQSSANLDARRLELHNAQDNETAAAQAFNSARGVESVEVPEKLVDLSADLIERMTVPSRSTRRDDVTAAEYQAKSTSASAQISREKDKPTLELFASTPLTSPTGDESSTAAQLLPLSSRAATTVGVRFQAPLDFSTLNKAREGWNVAAQAADLNFRRKSFDEQHDWEQLVVQFKQAQQRLKLYVDLERTQFEKLNYERDRQTRGRSTLEQVILYETDYQLAQLGRIQTLTTLLNLNAQMKLYGVSYESR